MCGITGLYIYNYTLTAVTSLAIETVAIMTRKLIARGPDAQGIKSIGPVVFGHRRLSIIDLTDAGAQPMSHFDTGTLITYNGEIYNFTALRSELKSLGVCFRGSSDTEVVLQIYTHFGLKGLKRLEGIFALAIWDPILERLVLMRDRMGVKPLFYGESVLGLTFGSEIKAVLAAGNVDTTLDDQAFSEYLWYGNVHGDRTFYTGVRSLEPGHWLIIEKGKRRLEPWWSIEEFLQVDRNGTESEAANHLTSALDNAVRRQLVSDVPVGIFLSGGIDSSAIAASAIRQSVQPLNSYAAAFDYDRGVNELPKASLVAKWLGLKHHELHISGNDLENTIIALAMAHDEPFADAANIPLYLMSKKIAGSIKVVLQGDGGDELFAGYRRYAVLQNAPLWRLWPKILSPLVSSCGNLGERFVRMAEAAGHSNSALRMAFLLTTESLMTPPERVFLRERQQEFSECCDPFLAYRNAAIRFKKYEPVQQMLLTDLTVQLPSQFLTKVDRATMAAGIEARVPFLDEDVVRLAVSLPSIWKTKRAEKKIVLRNSQRGRLPDDILDAPKTGFGVPYKHWLRTSLHDFARDRLLDRGFQVKFSLDGGVVEGLIKNHKNQVADNGFLLWKLLQLSLFSENQTKR